jgi:hypothetical protein
MKHGHVRGLTYLSALAAVGLSAIAATALAEDQTPPIPDRPGMMDRQRGGMMGPGMMGMMGGDPAQMTRMMENCNRMMESRLQDRPRDPAPTRPDPDKKG